MSETPPPLPLPGSEESIALVAAANVIQHGGSYSEGIERALQELGFADWPALYQSQWDAGVFVDPGPALRTFQNLELPDPAIAPGPPPASSFAPILAKDITDPAAAVNAGMSWGQEFWWGVGGAVASFSIGGFGSALAAPLEIGGGALLVNIGTQASYQLVASAGVPEGQASDAWRQGATYGTIAQTAVQITAAASNWLTDPAPEQFANPGPLSDPHNPMPLGWFEPPQTVTGEPPITGFRAFARDVLGVLEWIFD